MIPIGSPKVALLAVGLVLSLGGVAVAHHSLGISVDYDHMRAVEGTVKTVNWTNPHVSYVVESEAKNGEPARTLVFEAWSPGDLSRSGWTKLYLQPGDHAVFHYAPHRDGTPGGFLLSRHLLSPHRRVLRFVESGGLAERIRESDVLFPLIELVHVLSICLVVGSILAVDLRLLGLASIHWSVSRVTQGVLPLSFGAFVVAVASGSLVFISNASKYLDNSYFAAKNSSDLRRRPKRGNFSRNNRQRPATVGKRHATAACGTAGRRTIDPFVGFSGRMRALDRVYDESRMR